MVREPVTRGRSEDRDAPLLELTDASLSPPGNAVPLLRNVTLSLERGQIGVLLGGNGAGKTTVLRTVAGLWPLLHGRLRTPAGEVFDPTRVALILEDLPAQFVGGSVAEELEFALENAGTPTDTLSKRRDAVLDLFRLGGLRDRDPHTLSPGEQQRCLLAAVMVLEPDLVLMDDAFLYVGPGEAASMWMRIREWVDAGDLGAVLLATHDAELAIAADRVGVLAEGALQIWAGPETVLRGLLPDAVEVPTAISVETQLERAGFSLPPGALTVDAMTDRLRRVGW